jgi:hypothetical protein
MASIINASTSGVGGVITTADNSGDLNIQSGGSTKIAVTSAGVAVTGTLSASGGITVGATAAPAFSAYLSGGNQGITSATWTKVTFKTETFDTNNNFDSTTNYRFTPTVAGYYQINLSIQFTATNYGGAALSAIYKNGSSYKENQIDLSGGSGGATPINTINCSVSDIIYFNGTTDYIEGYGYSTYTVAPVFVQGSAKTWLSGAMIRSA